jgi:deoxyhypusine synthase
LLDSGVLEPHYQIDPQDSWLLAACRKKLPIFVPGWEDSTLGNIYASHCIKGDVRNVHTVKSGIQYMMALAEWYRATSEGRGIGFFQIGGGIAGDYSLVFSSSIATRFSMSAPASFKSLRCHATRASAAASTILVQ